MAKLLVAFLSTVFALRVLFLVKRNLLQLSYILFWIGVCASVFVLGVFPQTYIFFSQKLQLFYYPILPVVFAILLVFLKLLRQDIDLSEKEKRLKRLAQEMAIWRASR